MGNVAKLIEKAPPGTLVCRVMRHTYDVRTSTVERNGARISCTQSCSRCGVQRTQHLNRKGMILDNSYTYPNGYKVEGVGVLDAKDMGKLRLIVYTEAAS